MYDGLAPVHRRQEAQNRHQPKQQYQGGQKEKENEDQETTEKPARKGPPRLDQPSTIDIQA